jgi:hypothetical protein
MLNRCCLKRSWIASLFLWKAPNRLATKRPDLRGLFLECGKTFKSGQPINAMFSPLKSNQLPFLARCALSTTVLILAVIFLLVINGNARDQMNRQSATLGNFELEENLPSSKAFDFETKLHETLMQIRNEDWIKISKWSKLSHAAHNLAAIGKMAQIASKNSIKPSNPIHSKSSLSEKKCSIRRYAPYGS